MFGGGPGRGGNEIMTEGIVIVGWYCKDCREMVGTGVGELTDEMVDRLKNLED